MPKTALPKSTADLSADDIIAHLGLKPHPEGGCYVESYRHDQEDGARGFCTCIYYLLRAGERSHWHRVRDAVEIWHYYAGAPLRLAISEDGKTVRLQALGADLAQQQEPHAIVPIDAWQSAESLGDWTLVGCTVAPAFEFSAFEMAPPGWQPGHTP